jgi:hypothetical protein
MESMKEILGDVIYGYSRSQAIEDGAMVDVSELAREAGIKFPVAVTNGVWAEYIAVPEGVKCQDEKGRAWDIVWMLRMAITAGKGGEEIRYSLMVRNNNRRSKRVTLKAVCGPGDDGESVITIMLPDED